MAIPDANAYQWARDYCDNAALCLDFEMHRLCRENRTHQSEEDKDWILHHLHILEEQWQIYQMAIRLIDRAEEISPRDTIRVLRFFKALHRKNEILLAFYRDRAHGPLADVLNAEGEIRKLEDEERCNNEMIQCCTERLENQKAK